MMERALTVPSRTRALSARWSLDPGAVAAWLFPAALVTYLGMRSGGYDVVVSDQVAIAAWWAIFLVLAAGLAPLRLSAAAKVGLGLLAAYAAWTAASLIWTESAARTMGDVTLMLLYVALALLAFALRGRDAARLMLSGLAVAIIAIATVAVLSRLHFAWFSVPAVAKNVPAAASKLSYPIGYWNALAALMAMGIPLLLYCATGSRALAWRGLSAAGVPVLVLCVFLTDSRGGAIELPIALVLFLALARDRLPKLAVMLVCAAGSALVVRAADQRHAARDGLRSALAAHQGNQLIAITIAVAVAVALIVYAIALVERHVERPRALVLSRRRVTRLSGGALALAVIVFVAAGGPGFLHREWAQFKAPGESTTAFVGNGLQRLANVTGNGRYQYWQSAVRAADRHPFTGTGAGTFVYWWARDGVASGGFVQDAHSLYLQSLGELGYPGLILITLFILWILFCGVRGALGIRGHDRRLELAAATAGAAVFAVSAAFEWIWLIPVLPVTLFILAAVIFGPSWTESSQARTASRRAMLRRLVANRWLRRAAPALGAVGALAAIVVIALPMAATAADRQSESQASSGNIAAALASARTAVRLQPYAAPTWLQEALVLELAGDLRAALADAQRAASRETTNWQNWLVLSRLEARTGQAHASLEDYLRARSLDRYNPLFAK